MRRATWNPAKNLALPLETADPTEFDVIGLFIGTNAEIAARFAVVAACPHHRFRALTDRLDRAAEWFAWFSNRVSKLHDYVLAGRVHIARGVVLVNEPIDLWPELAWSESRALQALEIRGVQWPLPNLMLGVRITMQAEADEKPPQLAALPARWRFMRIKPSENIDLRPRWKRDEPECPGPDCARCAGEVCMLCGAGAWRQPYVDGVPCDHDAVDRHADDRESGFRVLDGIHLVEIAGGAGPEQLRPIQEVAQQVLDAQTGCHPLQGCACDGQSHGPALAIVAADVCVPCGGNPRFAESGACNAVAGYVRPWPEVTVPGHGTRSWNQRPAGWLP